MGAHPGKSRQGRSESRITMVQTIEGIVRHGAVRLPADAGIPDGARVYVLVAGDAPHARIFSPRLRHPEQTADFEMDITDATV